MQTALEKFAAQSRSGTVRVVYDRNVPEERLLPCPHYWDADYFCRDEATLDRLMAKAGFPLQKGYAPL